MTESQPYFRSFSIITKVEDGRRDRVTLTILRDEVSSTAPLEKDDNVKALCVVEADLSPIPDSHIPQRLGHDGLMYYVVECKIEISCKSNFKQFSTGDRGFEQELANAETTKPDFSASTSYTLLHNGKDGSECRCD